MRCLVGNASSISHQASHALLLINPCPIGLYSRLGALTSDSLQQSELFAIDGHVSPRHDQALGNSSETRTGLHSCLNLNPCFVSVLQRRDCKSGGDILTGLDILFNQHSPWLWLTDTMMKGLLNSQDARFKADDGSCSISS